jgi:hypothetical protein
MAKPRSSPWSCVGKFAFGDKSTARKVAKRMSQKGGAVTAYRCAECRAWHVGTSYVRKPKRLGVRRSATGAP